MATRRGFSNGVFFTGDEGGDIYVQKTIDIGDWDMDTNSSKAVAHGLSATEYLTAYFISAIIRNDADSSRANLANSTSAGVTTGAFSNFSSTNVNLIRTTGGSFDDVNHNATSYNRGWVTIAYIPDA